MGNEIIGERLFIFNIYLHQIFPLLASLYGDHIYISDDGKICLNELDEEYTTKEQNESMLKVISDWSKANPLKRNKQNTI